MSIRHYPKFVRADEIVAGELGGSFGIDINPDADRTYVIGNENFRWLDIHGDLDGAVTFRAKNDSGGVLTVGDIVYIKGVSGSTPTVDLADCSDPAKMPAFGMVRDASVNPNAETHIATLGSVESVDVPSGTYTLGSNVYVGTAGTFTDLPPTGEGNLIQNIGWVARVNPGGGPAGIIKVGGAGRTNAVPNLNQDKIFLGNASNQAVSTALSSINLSSFNNDLATGGSTDWILSAENTGSTVTRLFEDFMGSDNRSLKSHAPFFSLGTSSAYWDDAYDYTHDSTGVVRANTTTSAYARAVIMGPEVYTTSPSLGDEWTVEMRVRPEFNASAVGAWIGLGSFSPKSDLNTQTTEQVRGYGDTAKAGFYWTASSTYWYTSTYDNEGTNGGSTDTSTGVSMSNSTWVRIALHCKREELFSVPVWRTDCYVNGVKVGSSMYNLSGTRSPTWSFIHYNGGDSLSNSCLIDWIVFQYRRPSAVTYLDIEDLT